MGEEPGGCVLVWVVAGDFGVLLVGERVGGDGLEGEEGEEDAE